MYVDFKITCWERVTIPEEYKDEIQEKIKDGTIETANELIEYLEAGIYEGMVEETEETMTPEENGGCATIEMGEKGEGTFFGNAKI